MADKDVEILTQTVPDYHDGLHKKPNKSAHSSGEDAGGPASKNVFERYISQLGIMNFSFCMQCGWETLALSFQYAWYNGGPASIVYGSIVAGIGSTLVATSLAEMASMDPTVGAQYRWSARFAQSAPEFWGFVQGWITVIAWICNMAGAFSIMANVLSGLIIFNNPNYVPQSWHLTLYLMSFVIVPVLLNLALRRVINSLETIGGIFHVLFFIGFITMLATLAKRSTVDFVFNTLHTNSGWDNRGVAFSIGMLTTAYCVSSFDGVLHMIDETKEPRKLVPKAMFFSTITNSIMQFCFAITLMFCLGDYEAVTNSTLPITEVFYSATGSKVASTILVLMLVSIVSIANFNGIASVSRLVWAFARDNGLPFSETFTYIHPGLQVPFPALILVGTCCCLLSLINLGSAAAFGALLALPTIALYVSYAIPIILLLIRQIQGKHPQYGPWKLGRKSIPVKIAALCYLIYIIIFIPFPAVRPITSLNMNYAAPIFLGAVGLAMVDWFVRGKKKFEVPTMAHELETELS